MKEKFSNRNLLKKSTEKVEKNAIKSGESDSDLSWNSNDDIENKKNDNEIKTFDNLRKEKNSPENKTGNEKSENEIDKTNEAQQKWDKVKSEIETSADSLGFEIDKGIKDPVIALNAFEINTSQSCEGHIEDGISAPWIRIEAPNEPKERFISQNETFEKVAKKYNMPVEEAKKMFKVDAYWEAMHECSGNGETKDYQKWREESGKLLYTTKEILGDFYKNRQVPDNIKIKMNVESMEDMAEGSFEIFNGGKDYRDISDEKLSPDEKEALGKRQSEYREELQSFAKFLKDKFFSEGENYMRNKKSNAQEKIDQEKIKKIQKHIEIIFNI